MERGLSHWADVIVIVLYFCAILIVGIWTLCKPQGRNVQSYFLAGRSMPWFAVGASMFAANIGPEVFVGLAGGGAAGGISIILFEWFPVFMILMLSWLFLPVYISAQVYTLPEYMEKRYGGKRLRIYLSCLSITVNTVSKLATCMFSGTLFIQLVLDWNMYIALAVLIVVTMVFTALGGLKAVIYTGTFQTIMMVVGGVSVMIISFAKIGGYSNLEHLYFKSIPATSSNNTTCGIPRQDAFHIFQDPLTGDQPWPGLVLRASLGEVALWCCNQVLVQRAISAKSLSHAKGASILLGVLKLLPLFLMIFPGMISRILFTDLVSCTDPDICEAFCDNPVGCSNMAYPLLIMELLPVGLRGLLLAIMVSAIMTSLTAVLNGESTVFTMDIWRTFRPDAKERELLIVGRLFTVISCVIAIAFVPLVKVFQHGRLFNYMVAISGYLSSPLGILFLLSIFWKRTTEIGAFCGLAVGHVLGMSRLIVELMFPEPPCGEVDDRPVFLSGIHYMYFIQIQFLCTLVVTVALTLLSKPRTDTELLGVTWWTRYSVKESDTGIEVDTDFDAIVTGRERTDICDTEPDIDTGVKSRPETRDTEVVAEVLASSTLLEHGDNKEQDDISSNCTRCTRHLMKTLLGTNEESSGIVVKEDGDKTRYLTQDKNVSTVLNIFAIALMVTVAFLTGFYR